MLYSIVVSTFKVFSISSEGVNDEEVAQFILAQFKDDSRVNITQLLKWTSSSQEINDFFAIIKKEKPKSKLVNSLVSFSDLDNSLQK